MTDLPLSGLDRRALSSSFVTSVDRRREEGCVVYIISGEGYARADVVWTGVEMGWRIGGLRYLR